MSTDPDETPALPDYTKQDANLPDELKAIWAACVRGAGNDPKTLAGLRETFEKGLKDTRAAFEEGAGSQGKEKWPAWLRENTVEPKE